ncbi:MAG: NAD(P)-dependent oxidoreductase [Burkholderiales bacterium]|nr:NAD(P)-dependent oxidoreductase [Burkholderiales bacterium]
MGIGSIGILSPGEMGAAVGRSFRSHGHTVVAALNGRSERTRALAAECGIANVGSIDQLVRQCDLILSILAPAAATVAAQQVAGAMQATAARPLYVDCNSIAPQSARKAADFIAAAGGRFLDGALIGAPPGGAQVVHLYVSGAGAEDLGAVETDHVQVRVLGAEVGEASALRMCYSAFGEGLVALAAQLLVAAERFGVAPSLRSELLENRGTAYEWLLRDLPAVAPRAQRSVREMEEIALAFEAAGLTPKPFQGVAELYRWIADALAAKPVSAAEARSGRELIRRLGQS